MSIAITLDFSLRQGAFTLEIHEHLDARVVALFGPSGAGKTTVLESIAGLRTPEQGVIRIGARTLFDSSAGVDLPAHERHVGYVPQDLALSSWNLTVLLRAARPYGSALASGRATCFPHASQCTTSPSGRLRGCENEPWAR